MVSIEQYGVAIGAANRQRVGRQLIALFLQHYISTISRVFACSAHKPVKIEELALTSWPPNIGRDK